MEFLSSYAEFLAKTVTIVLAVLFILFAAMALRRKGRLLPGQLRVKKLNYLYLKLQQQLEQSVLDKAQFKTIV